MGKYEPLTDYLTRQPGNEVPMTFAEIEKLLAASLPPVSRKHRAWWSNNPSNSVMTKAWLQAGFRTERVDMGSERLVFRRGPRSTAVTEPAEHLEKVPSRSLGFLNRVRERLAGTVTIPTGVDITAPSDEVWDAER